VNQADQWSAGKQWRHQRRDAGQMVAGWDASNAGNGRSCSPERPEESDGDGSNYLLERIERQPVSRWPKDRGSSRPEPITRKPEVISPEPEVSGSSRADHGGVTRTIPRASAQSLNVELKILSRMPDPLEDIEFKINRSEGDEKW
jgi:hypothetical protein